MEMRNRTNSAEAAGAKKNAGRVLLPGLNRSRSGRAGEELRPPKPKGRHVSGREMKKKPENRDYQSMAQNSPREDKKFKEAMNWGWRNRSGDRSQTSAHGAASHDTNQEKHSANGNNFLTNFHSHSSRVVGGIERAGRGFAGIMRFQREDGSPTRGAEPKEEYQLRVINLPLVDQTRVTRITKTLPECMDKTEFWMPALVWRCIEYGTQTRYHFSFAKLLSPRARADVFSFLNSEACMSEGIYRQSGSYTRVKHYAMRFDTELDIDLLSAREKDELGDVNIIASLFKMWIREQPTQVIPQEVQDRVMKQWRADGEKEEVPQCFKDELSQLPPYHYYLLFAITCHISLVYACREENKMSFHNLHICFAPGLKVDHQVFKWLIENWRDCWQGCLTEEQYIKEEARLATNASMRTTDSTGSRGRSPESRTAANGNRQSSRTQSPVPPRVMTPSNDSRHEHGGLHDRPLPELKATGGRPSADGATTPTHEERRLHAAREAPMLSPVRPLDPLGDFMK